jgi:dTDP-4-dehydrorhamnose reductase
MRHAAAAGWDAIGAVHSAPGLRLDVRDPQDVRDLVERLRPDAIVHTAYLQQGDAAWQTNVEGAANVAASAASVGARLVHLSTDVVFDGCAGRPYTECDPPSPCTDYGRAKAESEARVAAADPSACIVRTSLVVGGDGSSRHEQLALDVASGRARLGFFTDEIRCPVHVADLAAALLELVTADVSGPLHVAGADAVSRFELAQLVTGRRDLPPARSAGLPDRRPLDCRLDCTRAGRILRIQPRGARAIYHPGSG